MDRVSRVHRGSAAMWLLLFLHAGPASAQQVLRLEDALARALEARPELIAAESEQRALAAAERQAALLPNPALSLEVEDVAGSGNFSGVEEAQTTLRVFQPIELGGDRRARSAVAAHQRDLASFDIEARRLDAQAETESAFVAVLIAQEEVHHAGELVELAVRERGAAAERVRGGAALGVEETRARFAEDDARTHATSGELALAAARRRLAATWGGAEPDFERAAGDLDLVSPPPPIGDLRADLDRNPDLARFAAERAEREARVAVARAKRVPDPLFGAGVRHLAGPGDAALVFEVAVPLPLFDRQQGAIAEAAERLVKLDAERASARRRAEVALDDAYARWSAAYEQVVAVRDRLLPGAERANAELQAAYRSGRVSQLDALAAFRTEFETVDRMLHQLGEYHDARIAAQRLIGGSAAGAP